MAAVPVALAFVSALALWLGAAWAKVRTNQAAATSISEEHWRHDPALKARYEQARTTRVRDGLRQDVPTAAGLVCLFILLSAIDIPLLVLLGVAVITGVFWASAEASKGFAEQAALVEAAGFRPRSDRALKALYWTLLVVEWSSFLAALCLFARMTVELADVVRF
jgi:hypothetical protein